VRARNVCSACLCTQGEAKAYKDILQYMLFFN